MHIVRKDLKNNRLYITLQGVISSSEAQHVKEKIIEEAEGLLEGFDVINDLSKLVNADETGGAVLKELSMFFVSKKANRIVRVVGQSKTGLMLFAKYTPSTEYIDIKYVPTLKEAEEYLNQK